MKKESLKFSIHNLILEDGVPGKELFVGWGSVLRMLRRWVEGNECNR